MTDVLYGGQGGPNSTTDLYRVDPVTGACTSVGPVGYALTGLAFDPATAILYGITSTNSGADPKSLITIDPLTGAGTLVGSLGMPSGHNIADIAFASDGTLYGVDDLTRLWTIDTATGTATGLGGGPGASGGGNGFTIDADGTLWIFPRTDQGDYFTLDRVTAAATDIGMLSGYSYFPTGGAAGKLAAAATNPTDIIYAADARTGTGAAAGVDLVTIDPVTGVVTQAAEMDVSSLDALAWTLPPHPPAAPLVVKLYDLASNLLADITPISLEKQFTRIHNGPRGYAITAPAGHHLLTDLADDGFPNLESGDRKLLVWEDGTIIFHGRIRRVERNGDGKQNLVTITAADPWLEFGFDADDSAGRPVRDATGSFIDPTFSGTGSGGPDVISGPDLIKQILTNSQGTDDEGGPNPGEGPLPIDLASGTFDIDVPPAVDLSVIDSMDWPVQCGDFIAQLVNTGVCDVELRPVDPSEGFDPYVMVALSAVSSAGTDRSATVHFDYFTGDHNAGACQHVDDFATICNKLYDYLGPRLTKERWRADIVPSAPGVMVDPSASRARYGGPGGGEFMQIRVFDSVGDETSSRPLYLALFNAELGYRVAPRQLLFVTPSVKPLFDAPADFDAGDRVSINTGADFGLALAESQRVLGYTKTWSRENIKRISQLVTRADVSLG